MRFQQGLGPWIRNRVVVLKTPNKNLSVISLCCWEDTGSGLVGEAGWVLKGRNLLEG